MADGPELRTRRLLLRRWRDDDRVPFAVICADPRVMRYFRSPLSRAGSDALINEIEARFEANGYGLWALEPLSGDCAGRLAGFTGLNPVRPNLPYAPAVEVGWRLASWARGRGYATESGFRAIVFGFDQLGLEEIVSFTSAANDRSRAVMERLGMRRDLDGDFLHPDLEEDDPLRQHVLYRLSRAAPLPDALNLPRALSITEPLEPTPGLPGRKPHEAPDAERTSEGTIGRRLMAALLTAGVLEIGLRLYENLVLYCNPFTVRVATAGLR